VGVRTGNKAKWEEDHKKRGSGEQSFCFHGDHQFQVLRDKAREDAEEGLKMLRKDWLAGCCGRPSRHWSSSGGTLTSLSRKCLQHRLYTQPDPEAHRMDWGEYRSIRPIASPLEIWNALWKAGSQWLLVAWPVAWGEGEGQRLYPALWIEEQGKWVWSNWRSKQHLSRSSVDSMRPNLTAPLGQSLGSIGQFDCGFLSKHCPILGSRMPLCVGCPPLHCPGCWSCFLHLSWNSRCTCALVLGLGSFSNIPFPSHEMPSIPGL
jgi:hypothetical protein